MTDSKPAKARARRSVSKARLYKELKSLLTVHNLNETDVIGDVLDALREDIVEEALTK